MKRRRDLRMLVLASLAVITLLWLGTVVALRKQQSELVQRFGNDAFYGRSASVENLIVHTDVVRLDPLPAETLICVVLYCNPKTVQLLLNQGVNVNARLRNHESEIPSTATGQTALHAAVVHRRLDMIVVLLRNGADVTMKWDGKTPINLMKVAPNLHGNTNVSNSLVRVGTDAQILQVLRHALSQSKGVAASR